MGRREQRAVVLGAAGFEAGLIGSRPCHRLLAEGSRVTGVDGLATGTRRTIDRLRERIARADVPVAEP